MIVLNDGDSPTPDDLRHDTGTPLSSPTHLQKPGWDKLIGQCLSQQAQPHPGARSELDHRFATQLECGDDAAGQLCVAARHHTADEATEQTARASKLR